MNATRKSKKKRVLVVDDNASDTQLLKDYLEKRHGFVVREENDPLAAISAAEEFKPELVLLDVLMPEMDGGELAAAFKANPTLKAVPIVFLTSRLTKEEVALCGGRIGGYSFLAKPIVLAEVASCLKRHMTE
ncbi:MAG TPA: response regulator [Candidatus Saccharimonadales bacterium]|nr:response regulator [Candidatus Saccharimonadales bacterium]